MKTLDSLRRQVIGIRDSLVQTTFVLKCETRLDYWSARSGRRRGLGPTREHLLVPTAGSGNIGDQAMFESFLENTTGAVTIVVQRRDSFRVPPEHHDRVSIVCLQRLFQGDSLRRLADRRVIVDLMEEHAHFTIIGADVMDGGYSPREAVLRFSLLRVADSLGCSTTVLGFSWNGSAVSVVSDAARRSSVFANLCVRDPLSAERLHEIGVKTTQVADVVFVLSIDEDSGRRPEQPEVLGARERPSVIVNASGLLNSKPHLIGEYEKVVEHLLERRFNVVLLPHVIRAGDDDLAACRRIASRFTASPYVQLVEKLLSPAEVTSLARRADAVFTGRMHLAVLAMNQEIPAVVISTQGKVEGMLQFFGLEGLAIPPDQNLGARAIRELDHLLESRAHVVDALRRSLPGVRELARKNFEAYT